MVGDYLITVEPNSVSGHNILSVRITGRSEEYIQGVVDGLKLEYHDENKYRVNYIAIK